MTTLHANASTKLSNTSAQPSSVRFASDELPSHDRLPFYKDVIGRHFLNCEVDLMRDRPFHCEAAFHIFPGLSAASVVASTVRGTRTRELIAGRNADEVVFTVSVRGATHLTRLGHEMSVADGEAALMPTDEPASVGLSDPGSLLMFGVPVDLLKPFVPDLGACLFKRVPCTTESLRLLVGYAGLMLRPEASQTPALRHTAAAHMRDLIALALGATRDGAAMAEEGGLRAARLEAIKAEVTREAASPDLNVGTVAHRHRLSPRSIQMLFEAEGTTFSQFVLEQRLMLAHHVLSSWQSHRRSITEIALDSGFSNVSYFNRAFRQRFGASPTEVRARHMN